MAVIRQAYGEALAQYGKLHKEVAALDADLAKSTMSCLFRDVCPDRFYQVGIAESNMAAMAAGMAACGLIPFVHTFAAFISSLCFLSARSLSGYTKYNVRYAGTNSGLTGAYDGSTHHSLDDLAVMSSISGMMVLVPSDGTIVNWMVKELIEHPNGPAYLRLSRVNAPELYAAGENFTLGKAKTLTEGRDVTVIACGMCTGRAVEAASLLRREGISIQVIDMFTINPLDESAIIKAAKETGAIVVAEEHFVSGGLGTKTASVLCRNSIALPFAQVGVLDVYTESGSYEDLVKKFHVDTADIAAAVRKVFAAKKDAIKTSY